MAKGYDSDGLVVFCLTVFGAVGIVGLIWLFRMFLGKLIFGS